MRFRTLPVLVALAAALPVFNPAADAAKRKRTCRQVKPRKDLAPAGNVKLFRRRNDEDGTDLLGCVLPRGRIRLVAASSEADTSSESYGLRQVAGAVLLIDTSGGSQYGGGHSTRVYDIRSDDGYAIASSCYDILNGFCTRDRQDTSAPAAFVTRGGQAAAAVTSPGTVSITGFSPRGTRTVLDSGPPMDVPPSSLRLRGVTASWTHSGQPRTARLPG